VAISPNTLPAGTAFPFAPYSRAADSPDNANDPYGFAVGNQYTLRWGAPGDKSTCGTDATHHALASNGSGRGYCCAWSASDIASVIMGTSQSDPLTIGQAVPSAPGAKDKDVKTIDDRIEPDPDQSSMTYAAYSGNGLREVIVPVSDGTNVVGFAKFLLLPEGSYKLGGNDSGCAIYGGVYKPKPVVAQ
jgi:hypothetical protein